MSSFAGIPENGSKATGDNHNGTGLANLFNTVHPVSVWLL